MSNGTVKVNNLADAIVAEMTKYAQETAANVKESVDTVAKQCVAEIKSNIDSAGIKKQTGKYRASWKAGTTKDTANARVKVVYSKNYYYLTHLLENGHAKQSGGRTKAFPHIAPAAEAAEKQLLNLIKKDV